MMMMIKKKERKIKKKMYNSNYLKVCKVNYACIVHVHLHILYVHVDVYIWGGWKLESYTVHVYCNVLLVTL